MRKISSQKGVSFVETIITLPVLMIITMCTVEASRYIRSNIIGAHLAYETARMAASWPSLLDYSQNPVRPAPNPRAAIVERILRLAHRQENTAIDSGDILINYTSGAASHSIDVQVSVPYEPVFNLWGKTDVVSRASVPYLYPEEN